MGAPSIMGTTLVSWRAERKDLRNRLQVFQAVSQLIALLAFTKHTTMQDFIARSIRIL